MVHTVEQQAVDTIRVLAADMTRGANSGHPGAPMGCAPMANVLYTKHLNVNPKNPKFINRDRFVLSNGHGCALQYILLHLMGFDVTLDDLKNFRQVGSKTPGHPEATDTPGLEVTTGPLGQGISNAVGLAAAQEHLAAKYNRPNFDIFSNYTYVILGDGCLQEGVALEAISLAGHWKLGKLICLYDSNKITIDGQTNISFTEDVRKRFESCGWHTSAVADGNSDQEGIAKAIEEAKAVTDKPSLIEISTTIGYGSLIQDTSKAHGSPLSADDIKQLKEKFGFNPEEKYAVPQSVYDLYAQRTKHGEEYEGAWNTLFQKYSQEYPAEAAEIKRRFAGDLPEGWENALPRFTPSDPAVASRKASEIVLNALAAAIPDFMSGSADLSSSNLVRWKTASPFQNPSTGLGDYKGQYLFYGVREHGMFAVMNGMACYGGIIPIGSTFLNFLTYGWGAVRLSALTHLRVLYVMTHDSIGLGEDGPTHQPIETLALTRATPNLLTFRPADANEVAGTYKVALSARHRPSVLALSRQALPNLEGSSLEAVSKGAYVLQDQPNAKVIITATGSEVSLAVEAANVLNGQGVPTRVVSMPCTELYDEQPAEYKKSVFTTGTPVVSVEALGVIGWERYAHAFVGMTDGQGNNVFGASGPIQDLYKKFNITTDVVVKKAQDTVAHFAKLGYVPELGVTI
ncbi:transketolase [Zychaea mexicana]|uniref:transketolase n=1 Tax=Zychaea mexicana TaxID=64656 RepID=UPI0022FDB505|nr:transketolase [Zychaea mexicana]KAI9490443.1 transketolase [Zychaea mexicana]